MAQLSDHHLHYRCAFELTATPLTDAGNAWGDLVRTARNWIAERIPKDAEAAYLQKRWFYSGGDWRPPRNNRWYVKTASHKGTGSDQAPQYWALCWEHPCSEVASRQWRTDIAVSTRAQGPFIFSLTTTHWLLPGFLGREPDSPAPSAPGIVTRLLGSKHWKAQAGAEQLGVAPFLLRDGQARNLLNHLQNRDRDCPLVLIAKDFSTGANLLDPHKLARLLAGTAVVWESESSWVDKELESLLPPDFRCWNGMVRVYQPRIRLEARDDARRHRYFSGTEIQTVGPQMIAEALVRGIVRRARPIAFTEVTTVDDVEDKQRDARLFELRSAAKGSTEWTEFLEKEVERLDEEVKFQKQAAAQIEDLRDQLEDLNDELKRLKYQHDQAVARAQEAESIKTALSDRASLFDKLEKFPDSVSEVVNLVARAYPNRIVFTEKAQKSSQEATFKDANITFECLRAMATTLYELHFDQRLPFREICQKFKNSTGFELAVGESETTKANKKLAALRKDVYDGESIEIGPHVRHGNTPGRLLRVHYYAHPKKKLLIVGHCGDHLDTVRTN